MFTVVKYAVEVQEGDSGFWQLYTTEDNHSILFFKTVEEAKTWYKLDRPLESQLDAMLEYRKRLGHKHRIVKFNVPLNKGRVGVIGEL